jgi:DnaJ like chaperone protein
MGGPLGAVVGAALGHAADQGAHARRRPHPAQCRRPRRPARRQGEPVRLLRRRALGQARQGGRAGEAGRDRRLPPDVPRPAREPARGRAACSTRRARPPRAGSPSPSGSARPSPTTRRCSRTCWPRWSTSPAPTARDPRGRHAARHPCALRPGRRGLGARQGRRAARHRARSRAEDPYPVLGLTREASDEEVRAAWRKLMRENHPDTPGRARRAAGIRQARDAQGGRDQRGLGPHQARARL